jgi:hypothetical protein
MEAPRLQIASPFADFWRLRCSVHSDPRLSLGAKCAWEFLFAKCGGRLTDVTTSTAELGHSENRSAKTAYDWLKELIECGYLEIIDRPRHRGTLARSGPWHVFLNDPTDVAKVRRALEGDGQGELFDRQEAGRVAAEDPQVLPADHRLTDAADFSLRLPARITAPASAVEKAAGSLAPRTPIDFRLKQESLNKTLDFRPLRVTNPVEVQSTIGELGSQNPAGSSEREPSPIAGSVASALEKFSALPSTADRIDELHRFSTWLVEKVSGLYETVAVEIASAVLDGRYPMEQLSKILLRMALLKKRGELRRPEAVFFAKAARKSIAENDPGAR